LGPLAHETPPDLLLVGDEAWPTHRRPGRTLTAVPNPRSSPHFAPQESRRASLNSERLKEVTMRASSRTFTSPPSRFVEYATRRSTSSTSRSASPTKMSGPDGGSGVANGTKSSRHSARLVADRPAESSPKCDSGAGSLRREFAGRCCRFPDLCASARTLNPRPSTELLGNHTLLRQPDSPTARRKQAFLSGGRPGTRACSSSLVSILAAPAHATLLPTAAAAGRKHSRRIVRQPIMAEISGRRRTPAVPPQVVEAIAGAIAGRGCCPANGKST